MTRIVEMRRSLTGSSHRYTIGLSLALLLTSCGQSAPDPSAASMARQSQPANAPPLSGRQTFVIVPEQSRASYRASEEFFPGAFNLLGIDAGKTQAVGSTQAIEGQFQLDPDRPAAPVGDNSFSVRLNTLTSDQTKRDDYLREIRDDGGPSFDAYPVATFKVTGIDGDVKASAAGRELTMRLTGDLTVRDISRPATFDVKAQLAGDTLVGVGTTQVRLSSFGIGPIEFSDILRVADEVGIEVQFTARAH